LEPDAGEDLAGAVAALACPSGAGAVLHPAAGRAGSSQVTEDSHREHLRRGFNWLGGATIAAKVIDFSTILIVLLFLTKAEVGMASIVISIAMVVEAFDGLGTAEALIQAKSVSRLQLDTLFWFVTGAAALVGALTLVAA